MGSLVRTILMGYTNMSSPLTDWLWVSPQTGKPVKEEWHLILDDLKTRYPRTLDPNFGYMDFDEIAWNYSDPTFDAGQAPAVISANNNNSPPFRVELGGRVRTRPVYVQVEFSIRSLERYETGYDYNPQSIFNNTKRLVESLLTANPRRLFNSGLTWIHPEPSIVQDGRMFTNFGMVGTLQPAFLETLQDENKWRYILLLSVDVREQMI